MKKKVKMILGYPKAMVVNTSMLLIGIAMLSMGDWAMQYKNIVLVLSVYHPVAVSRAMFISGAIYMMGMMYTITFAKKILHDLGFRCN